ncbi:peptidoglycan-binding protein (plasmid) [Pseudorhodobacter turbinis]|uniref:Peptidoglycan-binding protein n=1 Tax=Pseudorhodobacter turbinis TaxID=2500533 RepID=A0A4P8EJT4_9RHOB|nr:peptidoglycan-binding domain-containing protein [Pseudorhodobacter turbinis]QCO56975.1 peptidoglycan-binding protein [Pseudorhodobacter turbinis]
MIFKSISTAFVATAMVVTPLEVHAGDGLVGGIVGGIIGGVIVNEANKNRRTTTRRTTKYKRSTISSSQRAANREVQVALNYFGFPVGTPDGAIGPKSRGAISQYQAHMGFATNGNLNDWERDLLVQSYYRAQAGGALTAQQIASDPRGPKGLLYTYRDERLGIGAAAGGQMAAASQAAPQLGVAAAGTTAVAAAVPQFGAEVASENALPSFMAQGVTQVSLASHCNKISLVTNSNGGFVTQATLQDPAFALSEQFCLARTYAIAQGEELVSKVSGFTPQQISQQCEGFGPVMQEHVAALSLKSREEVMQGVSGFVLGSGMSPAQLAGTAKICLGVGYVTDNMDVAIGSALILTTVGEAAYAELIGHHLASGIGAAQRMDLSLPWFDQGYLAGSDGTSQVFAPGMADRAPLIRAAAYTAAGRNVPGAATPSAPVPAATLPAFVVPGATSANP